MNVLFLTTLPTLKACNSPYMQYYFKRFLVLHSSEVIFSFLIKKSKKKAIEIEIAFLHSLGNPKGHTLDHFFYALHSVAEKCFDIWGILKIATVESVAPGNNSFSINHIIRCRSNLLLLGFPKYVLVLIL